MDSDSSDIADGLASELDGEIRLESQTKLAKKVYQSVWDEFYRWEQDYSQHIISELTTTGRGSSDTRFVEEIIRPMAENTNEANTSDCLTLWQYDPVGKSPPTTLQIWCDVITIDKFVPYPRYESCTPSSKTISHKAKELKVDEAGEGLGNSELAFVPYADDHTFNSFKCIEAFATLAWIDGERDPDLEMIQLETTRRLHFTHGMSLDAINSLNMINSLRKSNEHGILWACSQRDQLLWPGSQLSDLPELRTESYCAAHDLSARVNSIVSTFCSNLGCIEPSCPTHPTRSPPFDPIKPMVTSSSMISKTNKKPCGDNCFHHLGADSVEMPSWDAVAIDTFNGILNITPDLFPCQLAVLCRKPCREVFLYRTEIFSDTKIEERIETESERRTLNHLGFVHDPEFKSLQPCHHQGPCDALNCECFREGQYCRRNCRCERTCKIRWKGCKCARGIYPSCIKSERCRCRIANRECDPLVCRACNPKGSKKGCLNSQIHRSTCPVIEIKQGLYGLGAFATRSYNKHDFIGDYIGEEVPGGANASLVKSIYKHTKLNYLFELSKYLVLNAAQVGNETRFLNHAPSPENNCDCRGIVVNNDLHMGLFATKKIAEGEELLLDYGPKYWESERAGENEHAGGDERAGGDRREFEFESNSEGSPEVESD